MRHVSFSKQNFAWSSSGKLRMNFYPAFPQEYGTDVPMPKHWKKNFVAWVHELTILTERPPLVGEVVPTFVDIGCRVVSATDPHGHILGFLDLEPLLFLPRSSSIVLMLPSGPHSRPTTSRKFGSAGNRTRDFWICSQELWPLDHRTQCLGIPTSECLHTTRKCSIRMSLTLHSLYRNWMCGRFAVYRTVTWIRICVSIAWSSKFLTCGRFPREAPTNEIPVDIL
jgi:hypothetical protein